VDVKFNSHLVFIYYNRTEIAKHPILSKHMTNGMRTEQAHLPLPLKKNLSVEELCDIQKRPGSRRSIFETEEKPYLRALPLIPYEVCEWSYGHKVGSNSHIWWNKGQYSVPYRYIGYKVDVKFNSHLVFIYYNRTEIAKHPILSKHMTNGMRTEQAHLPLPLKKNLSVEELCDKARETGPKTFEVIRRMFDEAKVKEQPMQTARAILSIADIYTPEVLEKACDKALRQYHMPYYKTIYSHARSINSAKELTEFKENNRKFGIIRGADYYKKRRDDK